MSDDSFSAIFAGATTNTDNVLSSGGSTMTSSSSRGAGVYFQYVVIVIGIAGTAANSLILYAMVASKVHKKQLLIFNQNVFDLCSCLLLIILYTVKVCNVYLTGTLGHWRCILVFSNRFLWVSINGSTINLLSVTIERYIKVVHPSWSKKLLRRWVKRSAAAFAWIAGFVYNMALVFSTSAVIDGQCYEYSTWKSRTAALGHGVWNFTSFYAIVVFIFVFCYGKILVVIRRQARVMAGHGGPGSSTCQQTQSNQIQASVVKTMILVSAFYVILWTPNYLFYLFSHIKLDLAPRHIENYTSMFLSFLYISANPFIYALKFKPVRRILVDLILCKKSVQARNSVELEKQIPGTAALA